VQDVSEDTPPRLQIILSKQEAFWVRNGGVLAINISAIKPNETEPTNPQTSKRKDPLAPRHDDDITSARRGRLLAAPVSPGGHDTGLLVHGPHYDRIQFGRQ
jgi:hypothetical protein